MSLLRALNSLVRFLNAASALTRGRYLRRRARRCGYRTVRRVLR